MKLLLVTQSMDRRDTYLGFFPAWVEALAPRFESIVVVCLAKGEYGTLPANVEVHSLGKEGGRRSPLAYAATFLRLAWTLRKKYDAVFVHMNQEYLLVAGWLWLLLEKPAYLWRNHYAGSPLTDLAALWCAQVFCTSKHSYTAKYKKTVIMPLGIEVAPYLEAAGRAERAPRSILFLARMAPSKRPELVLEALALLKGKNSLPFTATFIGSPLPEDAAFYEALKEQARAFELGEQVVFRPGIPHDDTPDAFAAHDIFVNAARSGMFDKTIFEAAAAGCLVASSSEDFKDAAGEKYHFADAASLAERLDELLALSADERMRASAALSALARAESLATLSDRLAAEIGRRRPGQTGTVLRFVVSGVLAAATNLGLTYLLERHSMLPYLAIVTIAVGTAIIVSFLLQKFFTFKEKSTARTHVQFAAFVGVAIANVFVTDLIVFLLVEFAGIRELVIDQIIAAIGVAAYSYFVYRHGIFKRRS